MDECIEQHFYQSILCMNKNEQMVMTCNKIDVSHFNNNQLK